MAAASLKTSRRSGLVPADIDAIVISHIHPDHVGNLRTADGSKAFPRATVFVPSGLGFLRPH